VTAWRVFLVFSRDGNVDSQGRLYAHVGEIPNGSCIDPVTDDVRRLLQPARPEAGEEGR
jgi:hypothetical protein